MNGISRTRLFAAAVATAVTLGASACDSMGCGGDDEGDSSSSSAPEVTCGAGTTLQAGQCVVIESAKTR